MTHSFVPLRHALLALLLVAAPTPADEVLEARPLRFGKPRHFALTERGDFHRASIQAEVTVTLKGGGGDGCAFFGLGAGQPDEKNYREPTTAPSLAFRFCPSDFAGGQVAATVNGRTIGDVIALGDGTHRLRLTWDAPGRRAWLDIHRDWKEGAAFTSSCSIFLPEVAVDFGKAGHLFAGGSGGVLFAGFRNRPLTPAEIAKLPVSDVFPHDPTAGTWLPVGGESDAAADRRPARRAADDFLADLGVSLRPLVCWYSGSRLQASRTLPNGRLEMPGSRWEVNVQTIPIRECAEARDLTLALTMREGAAPAAGLAAAFDFADWDTANYVLVPAAIYNGNRLRTVNRGYNAGLDKSDFHRRDLPLTQADLPRLAVEPGPPSKFEVSACNVSTPAVCVLNRKLERGFILLAEQAGRTASGDFLRQAGGEILDNAFAVEEAPDRTRATVVVSAPGVRERKPEFVGFGASPDRGLSLKPGDTITLRLRVFSFAAADIPALLDRFLTVRKDLTGPNHPRCLVPASQVLDWMRQRIDGRYLRQGPVEFYCPENGPWLAFGWIGGCINTFPMLADGRADHLERVSRTFDFGLPAQEPSGYFHYAIRNDGNTTFRDPAPGANLARTSGDLLFWMVKQFQLLKAQGRAGALKPEWETSMRKLADALVRTWKQDGQWGKLIDVRTGEVVEYNTTGGASVIGGLALAADYFHEPSYRDVAEEAARFYYQRDFVAQGFTTGACADILQNAESETAAAFMTSLMTLHESTGEGPWLEMSRHLADLTATWTVSHDYELPKSTELGGLGAKLTGVYWASTQNKHGAPGICTSSGDALFKIFRATGDVRYAELLRDIVAAHRESIRPGGFTNERLTFCDADSRGSRGTWVTGWNETNGALMALEIPGLYARTDLDRFHVFDSVQARVTKRDREGVEIEITNPTPHPAEVTVLAENAAQAARPLGTTGFLRWPKVTVPSGATRTVRAGPDGTLRPPPAR